MLVTCLGCGCACDDIEVVVSHGKIADARNACALGVAWFGDGRVPARARVAGQEVPVSNALDAAAALLARAARPLVLLAPDLSCEAQREAIALADVLRAVLDSVTSATALDSVLAAQERGRAGATLGEIRHRADVLVFWGVDPMARYPRYWTRYAPEAVGLHVGGRGSRTVVAVSVGRFAGPADADMRIVVSSREEVATLTALTALVSDADPRTSPAPPLVESPARQAPPTFWSVARELAPVLLSARYAVVVADAEPKEEGAPGDPGRPAALIALTQALNGPTRSALSLLRAGGNRSAADAVMTSQTGYPAAVDFNRGFPRYRPHDGAAGARLARQEIDALLIVGSASLIPAPLAALMADVPCAVIGPRASESALAVRGTVIDSGVPGIHEAGTAMRMDDVPLPLRAPMAGPPAATDLLRALGRIVRHVVRVPPA